MNDFQHLSSYPPVNLQESFFAMNVTAVSRDRRSRVTQEIETFQPAQMVWSNSERHKAKFCGESHEVRNQAREFRVASGHQSGHHM